MPYITYNSLSEVGRLLYGKLTHSALAKKLIQVAGNEILTLDKTVFLLSALDPACSEKSKPLCLNSHAPSDCMGTI